MPFCWLSIFIVFMCGMIWQKNRELKHKVELMKQQNELTHQYYEDMEI